MMANYIEQQMLSQVSGYGNGPCEKRPSIVSPLIGRKFKRVLETETDIRVYLPAISF